jgi:hypothetical protein
MEDAVARGQVGGERSGRQHGIDRSGWRRRGHEGGRRGVEQAGGRATGGQAGRWDALGRACGVGSIDRVGGACGDVGVRACRGAPGSVGRLDHWV